MFYVVQNIYGIVINTFGEYFRYNDHTEILFSTLIRDEANHKYELYKTEHPNSVYLLYDNRVLRGPHKNP